MKWGVFFMISMFFYAEINASEIPVLKHQVIKPGISFRGLCPVDNQTIWISGSKGTIGKSLDGGQSWTWFTIPGLEKADFRGIEAIDSLHAWAFSSGTPAAIVFTRDGGSTWKKLFYSSDTAIFFDAFTWDSKSTKGYVLGDPINGKFLWAEVNTDTVMMFDGPAAIAGEAAYAASNSNILIVKDQIMFISGGSRSALHSKKMGSKSWNAPIELKMQMGVGKGAFAICGDINTQWIAGGHYQKDGDTLQNLVIVNGKSQKTPTLKPSGYRSGISWLPDYSGHICCGTNGVDYSMDQGQTWRAVRWSGSFNTVKISSDGKATFLAGVNGRFAKVVMMEVKD